MTAPDPNVGQAAPEADLSGWTAAPFSAAGFTHDVYRKGEGPGVVLVVPPGGPVVQLGQRSGRPQSRFRRNRHGN